MNKLGPILKSALGARRLPAPTPSRPKPRPVVANFWAAADQFARLKYAHNRFAKVVR